VSNCNNMAFSHLAKARKLAPLLLLCGTRALATIKPIFSGEIDNGGNDAVGGSSLICGPSSKRTQELHR